MGVEQAETILYPWAAVGDLGEISMLAFNANAFQIDPPAERTEATLPV